MVDLKKLLGRDDPEHEVKELFQQIDFFSGLDDKILKKLADAAIVKQYPKGEAIVRQGEMGLGLYIILRGKVAVSREQDGASIQVAELGPQRFFAEMSIVDNKPRSATVTTVEDTECMLLTRDSFVTLMQKYPEIPMRVARLLAERLRAADERLGGTGGPAHETSAPPPPAAPEISPAAEAPVDRPPVVAPAAAPTPVAAPSSNGGSPQATAASPGAKAKVEEALLGAFSYLYTMKAFTRFSVAVLGCPVEGAAPNVIEELRIGEVKALLVPSDETVEMQIAAQEVGSFTLHVFVPGRSGPVRFGPLPIRPQDRCRLLLDSPSIRLCLDDRVVGPVASP